ncbi:MAG: hypothetical protein LBL26_10765 [Peptococcaceae bacterium]|jgi:fibro-slime domain-containing protein|nr:hypothetical protein [Peptococcaceae bacterium]
MRKQIAKHYNLRRSREIIAAFTLLAFIVLVLPGRPPMSAVGDVTLREMYAGFPNGAAMPDGSALLYYGTQNLDAMYDSAVRNGRFISLAYIRDNLPFQTDKAKDAFMSQYMDESGSWELLDVVYSKALLPEGWPGSHDGWEEERIHAAQARSSVTYVVKNPSSGRIQFIVLNRGVDGFRIHIDPKDSGKQFYAHKIEFREAVTAPTPIATVTSVSEPAADMPVKQGSPETAADPEGEESLAASAESPLNAVTAEELPVLQLAASATLPAAAPEELPIAPAAPSDGLPASQPEETPAAAAPEGLPEKEEVPPALTPEESLAASAETPLTAAAEVSPAVPEDLPETDSDALPAADSEVLPASQPEESLPEATEVSPAAASPVPAETLPAAAPSLPEDTSEPAPGPLAAETFVTDKDKLPADDIETAISANTVTVVEIYERPTMKLMSAPKYNANTTHNGQILEDAVYLPANFYDYERMQTGSGSYTGTPDTFNYAAYDYGSNMTFPQGEPKQFILFGGRWGTGAGGTLGQDIGDQNLSHNYAFKGIAAPVITDGAFQLNGYKTYNGQSLFPRNAGEIQNDKMLSAYFNRKFPFVMENGYYVFDSDKQHFHVYDDVDTPALYGAKQVPDTQAGSDTYGGFYPFTGDDPQSDYANKLNLFFGVSMEAEFMMPLNRQAGDKDMIFEFSGDDDMWVYIDGYLTLDIGGSHGRVPGSINFNTGDIFVEGVGQGNLYTGIASAGNASISRDAFLKHTMNIFYMERGGYNSNCYMKFNLPIPEPDKVTVFKNGESNVSPEADFEFDVYRYQGGAAPIGIEVAEHSVERVKKGQSFTIDVPKGETVWVRIIERDGDPEQGSDTSTIYIGDGLNGAVAVGKDTKSAADWLRFEGTGEAYVLFCVNYAETPITLVKHDYEHPDGTPLANVSFNLYKYENPDSKTLLTSSPLKTNEKGKIFINDYIWRNIDQWTPLERNAAFVLEEIPFENYAPAPLIYFETTGGVSPKVKRVWQTGDNPVDPGGLPIEIEQLYTTNGAGEREYTPNPDCQVFASEDGRTIHLYNKKLRGQITVEKWVDADDMPLWFQGDPIFLFQAEKLEKLGESDAGTVAATYAVPVRLTQENDGTFSGTGVFSGLEAGYRYRISELNALRYDQMAVKIETDGVLDEDHHDGTVTVLLDKDHLEDITVTFTNKNIFSYYLSDSVVTVNRLHMAPHGPPPSAPYTYQVTVRAASGGVLSTQTVALNDLITLDVDGLGDINPGTGEDNKGAIGTMDGKPFYPWTPITGDCVVTLYPKGS